MASVFITGSADGLGQLAAGRLIREGHRVVLHARNAERADHAAKKVPGADKVLIADLSEQEEVVNLADKVNAEGPFNAIIHNAGVFHESKQTIFRVNTLAPYILTCLIDKPERLIYMSSGMHLHGHPNLDKFGSGQISYSDSKLHDVILAKAVARKWPGIYSNAVDPGWVPTKMGGAGARDDLQKGFETQVWLAVAEDAIMTGRYFFHKKEARYQKGADNISLQDRFLEECERITGISFPD